MILRNCLMILSIWLSVSDGIESERWSRQTAHSEWIPLARPRSHQPQTHIPVANHAQVPHVPSVQSINLPPALRQEYQQQLFQLQKTQDSINKILLLQQQVRAQQQLLQNQAYLPNVVGPDEERQQFRQNPVPNGRPFAVNQEVPTQLSSDALPSIYPAQQFKSHSDQEVQETPSGSSSTEEKGENPDEEIQVVYVPAETLAQRGQSKEERNRDHKQFSIPRQQQRYQVDHIGASGSAEDGSYSSEVVQFPRGQEADQFFKDARQKELDRLNEERKEIQKQAKLQAAARQREHERARQREAEKKLKELAKIEELAKQRELDRLREARERARLEELERAKERAQKLKEEQARQEIERLTALERQKNAEIEQSLFRQKELEKLAREEEEARAKELAAKQHIQETEEINHQQYHTEIGKHKNSRLRKPRPRVPLKTTEDYQQALESSTLPPPNQPPLAVFMGSDLEAQEVKVVDVLHYLKDAKSISVLDQINTDAPKVFVGPSNLGPIRGYTKFELPYLSSLDTNRVERRVDKLPFFVAPLSFNPPAGYSKIPFPAPHIGSVIVNNVDYTGDHVHKPAPNPLIEPNSFPPSGQGSTYQTPYDSSTASPYTYTQQQVTPQYQTSAYPSTHDDRYKYRQQYQQAGVHNLENQESPSISPYQEVSSPRPSDYSEQSYLGQVTPDGYQRPNVVSSYTYSQNPVSTTPVYQDSYTHTRNQPNKEQELTSQLAQINQHDYSQHQHAQNPFLHVRQQSGLSHNHHLYHINPNVQQSYEDISQTGLTGPQGPTQYSLPAELPPIHPQLPGLVNSLLEGKEADKITTTTATTPELTTTTTEATTTNGYRGRVRQRGRIATRPTTPTTTSSPALTKSYERTRRPFNRSRSRYTTSTTEEYRDTSSAYEPTKAKVPDTTQRYNHEQYRRPIPPKIQKLKDRTPDRNTQETTTLNQIPNQETLSDDGSLSEDSNSLRQSTYSHYNVPLTTESPSAYLHEGSIETSPNSFSTERDYSKNPNYPPQSSAHRNEKVGVNAGISQQNYQDRFQAPASGYTANLESQTGAFEYDTRDGIRDSTPAILSSPVDYNYYQDKNENVDPGVQTVAPIYSQILEYRPGLRAEVVGQSQGTTIEDEQRLIGSTALPERELETTTEIPTTTTSAPVILRQRVRARLGGRPRQDSAIQTQPRGPGEEYVRFSAVNTPSRASTTRARDSTRPRPKTRPNYYNQAQVQSEGNEYVRIQSANRNYPKTIVQAAAPRTTTTTIAPLTTTEETSLPEDDEYGFIRTPSFNQPHHQISSKFRAPESQSQLQNVAPTDETAEDSSPTHTQIPKHRQKYQSPNRPRPTIKSSISAITTPPTSPETSSFTTKPRVRAEEPKNRLRVKGRRPARKRTTTTSTTTEYVLEGNNNLPLEENYPKIQLNPTEANIERQQLYDSNYDTLPPNSGSLGGPSRADYVDESYPTQDFMLNFGATSLIEEQQDQSHSLHHGSDNYHVPSSHRHGSGSRSGLRSYASHAVAPERDIYGSESQWSTKLTQSSFQPINQLNQDEEKIRREEEYQGENKDAPEIITAQPEEYITMLVTSDNQTNITKVEDSSDVTTESADFGMKMTAIAVKREGENTDGNVENVPQIRRPGRRRRVRIRVRPAQHDDFVTAESQHFNSAVNNLVQDRMKYTTPDNLSLGLIKKAPESSENQPSTTSPPEFSNGDESITPTDMTTINYTEISKHSKQLDVSTLYPMNNEESMKTKYPQEPTTTTERLQQTQFDTTLGDNSTPTPLMTTMSIPRKSWDSMQAYNDWLKKKMEKPLIFTDNELDKSDAADKSTDSSNLSEDSYPKNHRSEWSEVRYPSDRNVYGYGRSEKVTTTQVPGLATKTSGDSLTDYVQAIFDSMKTADEQHAILDNGSNLWNDEGKTTTQVNEFPSALSTIMGIRKTSSEAAPEDKDFKSDKDDVSTWPSKQEKENMTKVGEVSETPTESSTLKEQVTTLLQTTSKVSSSDSNIPTTMEASTTTVPTSTAKNASSILGAILRTSTSTKVSHMTEICYRGRCVMTKPKKDFHER